MNGSAKARFGLLLFLCTAIAVPALSAIAQTDTAGTAHGRFDVDVEKMMSWLEDLGVSREEFVMGMEPELEVLQRVKRIHGWVELPSDMATAMQMMEMMMGPGRPPEFDEFPGEGKKGVYEKEDYEEGEFDKLPVSTGGAAFVSTGPRARRPRARRPRARRGDPLPINFVITIEFANAEEAGSLFEELSDGRKKVIDGKTYYMPPETDQGAPSNLMAHMPSDTELELGTEAYVLAKERAFGTDRLNGLWDSLPDHAIRVAVDVASVQAMTNEAVEMAKQGAPPMAVGMLNLIPKIAALRFTANTEGETLTQLMVTGVDEDAARELATGLNGLLGFAKMASGEVVAEFNQISPECGKMMGDMIVGLNAVQDNEDVTISIARPEGFEDTMRVVIGDARQQAKEMVKLNNVRQVALGIHIYHDIYDRFPSPVADGDKLGWRTEIAPYLEFYGEFDTEKPRTDPANMEYADAMPECFGSNGSDATVCFIVPERFPKTFADVTDGSSNTIMVLENPAGVPWMENRELTVDQAVALITGLQEGESLVAGFYDGSVRRLYAGLDAETVRAFLTPQGGEIVDWDVLDR